ncbi:MAG: type I-D CRISPR-associated protein Cas7/Csc2 [Chloroflexota bacterium]|nr:type I-D CRISPR-associated protein Cas7/Csc2 [Chloroflexota bacterium]
MTEQFTELLNQYRDAFHTQIPRYRQNRYAQIVVLRETKSHAIFTTEGRTLDVERLQAGNTNTTAIDRVVMYKRKQVAPERRTGKALLRDLGILKEVEALSKDKGGKPKKPIGEGEDLNKDKGGKSKKTIRMDCQIMGGSCGMCPDCILYGYAATTGTGSQKARVLTDSGFVVRSEPQVMRDIKLNAIQDTIAGGIAGSAFSGRENLLPQVFIPTVETLLDVTAAEFTYVLGNILKTTRYGAESNREGFIRNHVLAIYFSDVELFSNLELTQYFYDGLTEASGNGQPHDYLSLEDFINAWPKVEQKALAPVFGRRRKVENLAGLLGGVRSLFENETALRSLLEALDRETLRYVRETKSKDKDKAGEGNEAEGEE